MEICAIVFEPTITCPIEFDFNVSFSTYDGSAGVYKEVAILSVSQHDDKCHITFILFTYFLQLV